jgi:hypothetical protein
VVPIIGAADHPRQKRGIYAASPSAEMERSKFSGVSLQSRIEAA